MPFRHSAGRRPELAPAPGTRKVVNLAASAVAAALVLRIRRILSPEGVDLQRRSAASTIATSIDDFVVTRTWSLSRRIRRTRDGFRRDRRKHGFGLLESLVRAITGRR